jgi:hypothetical protein
VIVSASGWYFVSVLNKVDTNGILIKEQALNA